MSSINVYGIIGSPFLRSVEIALKEKAVDYQLRAMVPGEHKQPEHLARHAFGRIPAFDHDGFALYETQAIIRYLDDVFPNPPLAPGNPKQRARMNQVIGIIECLFFSQGRRADRVQSDHWPEAARPSKRRGGDQGSAADGRDLFCGARRNLGRSAIFRRRPHLHR